MWSGPGIHIAKHDTLNPYANRDWKWEKLNSREHTGSKEESNTEWPYISSSLVRHTWKHKRTIKHPTVHYDLETPPTHSPWLNHENITWHWSNYRKKCCDVNNFSRKRKKTNNNNKTQHELIIHREYENLGQCTLHLLTTIFSLTTQYTGKHLNHVWGPALWPTEILHVTLKVAQSLCYV